MPLSNAENLAREVETACRTAAAAIRSGKRRSEDDIRALLACLATFNSRQSRYYEGSLVLVDTRKIRAAIKRVNGRLMCELLGEISGKAPIAPSNTSQEEVLSLRVSELDFSTRVQNCLRNEKVYTVRELVNKTPHELCAIRNFGETCLSEVKRVLAGYGLRLGMTEEELVRMVGREQSNG